MNNVRKTSTTEEPETSKSLNFWYLISKGFGGTIGGPIFVILGTAILRAQAGLLISLIINSVVMLSFVMNFSELALSLPIAGGGYSFSKEAIGGIQGFLIGWLIWVGNLLFGALSGLGFAFSLTIFVPSIPAWVLRVLGLLIIAFFYYLNLKHPKLNNLLNKIFTFTIVGGFLVYIILGFTAGSQLNSAYSTEILTEPFDFGRILTTTAYTFVIFCVYEWNSTYESLTSEFERIQRPRKNIPRAFLGALIFAIFIYWFVSLVTLLNIGSTNSPIWNDITTSEAPLAEVFSFIIGHPIGLYFMGFVGLVATMTSINSGLQMSTHVLHSLSRDGYIHKVFQKEKNGVQWVSLSFSSILTFILTISLDSELITEISNFIFLISMLVLSISVIVLRNIRPNLIRPWKVPLYPATPIFSIISSLILIISMFFSEISLWGIVAGIFVVLLGILYYFFQIARRDRLLLMLAGAKVGISLLLLGVLIGLDLKFISPQGNSLYLEIILLIFAGIGLLTLFIDVVPIRKIISRLGAKKHDANVVFGIFQLSDYQEKLAHRYSLILGWLMISMGIFSGLISPFLILNIVDVDSPLITRPSQFLPLMTFVLLLLQGLILILQGLLIFFQEQELKKVQVSQSFSEIEQNSSSLAEKET